MIDHVSIPVSDLDMSQKFFDAVLAPLGMTRMVTLPERAAYGKRYPELWLNLRPEMGRVPAGTGSHLALRVREEAALRAAYDAALQYGGSDAGPPGPRQAALTSYIGAFFTDPDGNRIELMTFPAG